MERRERPFPEHMVQIQCPEGVVSVKHRQLGEINKRPCIVNTAVLLWFMPHQTVEGWGDKGSAETNVLFQRGREGDTSPHPPSDASLCCAKDIWSWRDLMRSLGVTERRGAWEYPKQVFLLSYGCVTLHPKTLQTNLVSQTKMYVSGISHSYTQVITGDKAQKYWSIFEKTAVSVFSFLLQYSFSLPLSQYFPIWINHMHIR